MANISQNVNIEMLEKLPDGTYKRKYPKTRADDGTTFDEHLADNVSQGEIHGFRLTDRKLEYFDGQEWQKVKGDGYPIGTITIFSAKEGAGKIDLNWEDPDDGTITDSNDNVITIARWKGTKILRKTGSYPINENDGVLVVDNGIRNQYATEPFTDAGLINETTYYYAAYPYSEDGLFSEGITLEATPTARTYFYNSGVENVSWRTYNGPSGTSTRTKYDTHFYVSATGSGRSEGTFKTEERIDFSNISQLFIEWEGEASSLGESGLYFGVTSNTSTQAFTYADIAKLRKTSNFNRTIDVIDVSTINNPYFVGFSAHYSGGQDVLASVYRIWGV